MGAWDDITRLEIEALYRKFMSVFLSSPIYDLCVLQKILLCGRQWYGGYSCVMETYGAAVKTKTYFRLMKAMNFVERLEIRQ